MSTKQQRETQRRRDKQVRAFRRYLAAGGIGAKNLLALIQRYPSKSMDYWFSQLDEKSKRQVVEIYGDGK